LDIIELIPLREEYTIDMYTYKCIYKWWIISCVSVWNHCIRIFCTLYM